MKEVQFLKAEKKNFELLESLFPDDYFDRYEQFLNRTIDVYFVLYKGQPVGRLVANYTNQHLPNETAPDIRVNLSHFILLKEYRLRGLGSQLLKYAIEDLTVCGYKEFTVGVEEENSIAKHLYFENGFIEVINHGHIPCEYDLYLRR